MGGEGERGGRGKGGEGGGEGRGERERGESEGEGRTEEGGPFNARDANNADQLFQFVNEKWEELANDEGYLQALIDSMPNRLQAVIDQQGGWTRY